MLTTNLSRRDWLKVSAVGALGTIAPIGLSSKVFGHDQAKMPGLDFSLEDVRIPQTLGVHPRTGQVTTQNERRAMVEMRLHVGVYKGIAAIQRMAEASPADTQHAFRRFIGLAIFQSRMGMTKYGEKSLKNIRRGGPYVLGTSAYAWGKPQKALVAIRSAVSLNPEWAGKNFEPGLLGLLDLKIEKGVVSGFSKSFPNQDRDRPAADGALGGIVRDMEFRPLTGQMLGLLNDVERSHDVWITAAKDNAAVDELDSLVNKHHRQHHDLESLARDHQDLTLLALQHHMHNIDRGRPKAEIDKLLDESNQAHRGWVKAVRERDFPHQWATGLDHARCHIMLGVKGLQLRVMSLKDA